MEPLVDCGRILGFGDGVQGVCGWINDRSSGDSNVGDQITAANIVTDDPCFVCSQKAFRSTPQIRTGGAVGVKYIYVVVLSSNVHNVMFCSAEGQIGNPKRLSVDGRVHVTGKQFTKGRCADC